MFFKFHNSRTIQGDAKKCPVCKFPISRTAFKNCKKMQNFRVFKPANRLTTKNTIPQLVYRLTSLHQDTNWEFTKNMKKCIRKHEELWILMTSLRGSTNCGVGQNMKKHENSWRKHKNVNIFYPEFLIGRRNSMKKCIKKHKKT